MPRKAVGRALVGHFLDRWEGDETPDGDAAHGGHQRGRGDPHARPCSRPRWRPSIAKLAGEPRAAAAARAGLIATQMLGLALCRYVLKLPPVVRLERAEIVRRIGATVQAYLYDA